MTTVPVVAERSRPPAGWRVIAVKELGDHLLSFRFIILLLLLGIVGVITVNGVAALIRDAAEAANQASTSLFLLLFTATSSATEGVNVPSFLSFVALLGPLLGIAFGFDAVSTERAEGTLPRLVSQPIYRDDVINGKFLAGLSVISLILGAVVLVLAAFGMIQVGIVPSVEDILRLATWFLVAVVYVGLWLAFATLCSVVFRRAATAALVTISLWLVLGIFWGLILPIIGGFLAPIPAGGSLAQQIAAASFQTELSRLSPGTLFQDISRALLDPTIQTLSFWFPTPSDRALATILPYTQSLLVAWPYGALLIAMTVISFAAAYIVFMRQEVRA